MKKRLFPIFLPFLFVVISSAAQTVERTHQQPVCGYGYYYNEGYNGSPGPNVVYAYTPNYYVVPHDTGMPVPPVIYAPPVVYVAPAPAMMQRQEVILHPTVIYNNGPISAYNEYPRTILPGAMDR